MSSRDLILTAILFIGLAVGTPLLASENYLRSVFQAAQPRDATIQRQVTKPPQKDVISSRFDSLTTLLAGNRELLVYGGIASFGILMMGLAIGNVSSNSKSKTAEQLELLKQEKEKAENLAKLKSEFLNQVSHELRTPLAVIIGYIECITDGLYGEIETKHQEILQVVAKQSTHLKNMIDQILIYSRLEAGKQPLRIEDLQLTKIVNELRETFEFLCRQKGIDLRWELPREPMPIRSDAVRLKEVVSNLLQNAVKYTDHGSITVLVASLPSTDSVTVEVKDSGMGISEHHLTGIFEPFMQAHKTSSENSRGGIGLGLSIVKKHLDQLRGTIAVESELGKGSTFRVVLPKNYEKQKSRASQLIALIRRKPSGEHPIFKPGAEARGQQAANTSHAIG
ncbi:MAG TPA: HAMP domain-containing sensor histidine kinase [Candidatus Udaeobacter sp.]|nr:HAMP domain-containing sensor histidine kinase [Candidatus Udaeobacter sp.]